MWELILYHDNRALCKFIPFGFACVTNEYLQTTALFELNKVERIDRTGDMMY